MPKITMENVTKRWGQYYAVDHLNLEMEDNAFITLLGPSGCGKTTTLRMIAGLETPTSGKITIGDTVVFDSEQGINIPPNKRHVGFLFQNYALWPNMTVYKNIAFGLKNIKKLMPNFHYELKNITRLIEILKEPQELLNLYNDCKDKEGKINENKAFVRLMDTYFISIYTAKKLYKMDLENASTEIEKLKKQASDISQGLKTQGHTLNEEFAYMKDGEVEMQNRHLNSEEIDLSVRRVSRIVKIGMFMDRYPNELSGGQQQRVAIARTLAPEPTVLFMDEPLSNLDAKLRLEMRYELQRLHLETGSTFVYVTHDQMEAMTLATKICLINNGVLQQYDAPLTVYKKPANLFVADFVGNPSINFIEAKDINESDIKLTILKNYHYRFIPNEPFSLLEWKKNYALKSQEKKNNDENNRNEKGYVEKGNKDVKFHYPVSVVDEDLYFEERVHNGFILGIRPEALRIESDGDIDGEIYGAMPSGMESVIKFRINNYLLTSVIFGGVTYPIGHASKVTFEGNGIMLFDQETGELLSLGHLEKVDE